VRIIARFVAQKKFAANRSGQIIDS